MFSKLKNIYHFFLAWLGAIIYRNPSRELTVIGITGTKGKTTSVELLRAVLEQAGKKTAMLSSAHIGVGGAVTSRDGNTMPGRFFIQKFLRQAVTNGCRYAVFEVTSQGVIQYRHRFIDFDVAAITCLHPEHIESHGGYEQYRGAKVTFFRDVARLSGKSDKKFFINGDMASGGDAQYFDDAVRHPLSSRHSEVEESHLSIIYYARQNFLRNELGGDKQKVSEWLQGDFNLENAAMVYAIAYKLGVPRESILETFKDFAGVAGRLEFIRDAGKTIVIDSALTPGSLRAVYLYLRSIPPLQKEVARPRDGGFNSPFTKGSTPAGGRDLESKSLTARLDSARQASGPLPFEKGERGKLIAVFGSAGGGRDRWKRPELGKIADEFCDKIYLTTDDSYDEKTETIIAEIQEGIFNTAKCKVILDRAEAISEAIRSAGSDDIVAVTGMGSQMHTYGPHGKKTEWSDRKAVDKILFSLS